MESQLVRLRCRPSLIGCTSVLICMALTASLWAAQHDSGPQPRFIRHVIESDFSGGYQVTVADLNRDSRPDIVALSTEPARLVWYANPDWRRMVLTTASSAYIDVAPQDIDRDGDLDLAVAGEFDLRNTVSGGTVFWLECPGDPEEIWSLHPIDAVPTSHRIRWADTDGDGVSELVNLPILGVGAQPPEYRVGLEFKAYRIPSDPRSQKWAQEILDTALNMAHGIRVVDWDADGKEDLLTASFEGVHLFQNRDGNWVKTRLGEGEAGSRPAQGSSEVAVGRTGSDRFIATIEPWHGSEVVVYRQSEDPSALWRRQVIESGFDDGHALACSDLDGDGSDEIIAGHRGRDYNLFYFQFIPAEGRWQKYAIDLGGLSAAGISIADLNGDGRPDIAAAGSATGNVVWYENMPQ